MLKRSGFRRPTIERKRTLHTPVPEHLRRGSMAPVIGIPTSAIEKENPLQHRGYMAAVRKLPCAHCGRPGPSQFCHMDEGKGTGIKSDCRQGWPGCGPHGFLPGCHFLIGTQRIYDKEERRALEARYAAQTRSAIVAAGLWPKKLPMWSEA